MSKRSGNGVFGEGRREDENPQIDDVMDTPMKASSEQLAKRKIRPIKGRLASATAQGVSLTDLKTPPAPVQAPSQPMNNFQNTMQAAGGGMMQAGNTAPSAPAQANNPFAVNPNPNPFNFGATAPQPAAGGSTFNFGASAPQPAAGGPTFNAGGSTFNGGGSTFNAGGSTFNAGSFGTSQMFQPTPTQSKTTRSFGSTAKRTPGNRSRNASPSPAPQNNLFANASFPAFGGNNSASNPQPAQAPAFNPQPPQASGFDFSTTATANPFGATKKEETSNTAGFTGSIFKFGGNATPSQSENNSSGLTTSKPASNLFGQQSSTPAAEKQSTGFSFSSAQSQATGFGSTPATSASKPSLMFGAGTPATDKGVETSKGAAATPQSGSTLFGEQSKPASSPFAFGGQSSAATPASNIFGQSQPASTSFGAQSNATTQPFGQSQPAAKNPFGGASSAAPSSSLFAQSQPASTLFGGQSKSGSEASKESESAAKKNPFGGLSNTGSEASKASEPAAKKNPFGGLSNAGPEAPKEAEPAANPFGGLSNAGSEAPKEAEPSAKKNPFGGMSNAESETSKEAEPAAKKNPFGGLSSATQSSNLFGQSQPASSTLFSSGGSSSTGPQASNPFSQSQPAGGPPQGTSVFGKQSSGTPAKENPFGFLQQTQPGQDKEKEVQRKAQEEQGQKQQDENQRLLEEVQRKQDEARQLERPLEQMPNIPKARVPSGWSRPSANGISHASNLNGPDVKLVDLAAQLATLNRRFKAKISNTPDMADWSHLSRWHLKESKLITKQIEEIKKERARLNGVTGNESTVTKRKATNDTEGDNQFTTPSKKARGESQPSQQSPISFTPKATPPTKNTSQTSNLFGNILNNSSSSGQGSSQSQDPFAASGTKAPSIFGASVASSAPGFGASTSSFGTPAATSTPKPPSFGITSGGASGFSTSAFASKCKTAEQLTAERKAKDRDADYDSDDEPYEEWSARWDKKEAARKEAEAKAAQGAKGFTVPAAFNAPTAGKSTASVFGSSANSSRAPSTTPALSVFGAPSAAPSPGSNPFSHLSSAASSNHQDESDEDESEHEEQEQQAEQDEQTEYNSQGDRSPPGKRKLSDSGETSEESAPRKKPSLKDRITFGGPSETASKSDNVDDNTTPKANGAGETANRPFAFFDFGKAGAAGADAGSTHGGDQTFKPGTPIKFGASTTASSESASKPLFNYQPPTPKAAEGEAKAAATSSTFSLFGNNAGASSKPPFLTPNAGSSNSGSAAASVFSSRAATPLSDAGSAAENEEGEDSGGPTHDLSKITEDEKKEYNVLFQASDVVVKTQAVEDGKKSWKNIAHAPVYMLQNKETGKVLVRVRMANGRTAVNSNIVPKLKSSIAGKTHKMVSAIRQAEDGKIVPTIYNFSSADMAKEFSTLYNDNVVM